VPNVAAYSANEGFSNSLLNCTLSGPFEYVFLACSQLVRLSVKAS